MRQAVIVVVVGGVFSLAANRLSPRGLSLTRDYFPSLARSDSASPGSSTGSKSPPTSGPVAAADSDLGPVTVVVAGASEGAGVGVEKGTAASPEAVAEARLREHGLRSYGDEDMVRLFEDPRYAQELVVFVDARDAKAYREGHIPGAYQFDRYHPEVQLPAVVQAGQNAEVLVVYCNGGECEDSEYAAVALRDAGVPSERIGVYLGGITAWRAKGLPIESGERAGHAPNPEATGP